MVEGIVEGAGFEVRGKGSECRPNLWTESFRDPFEIHGFPAPWDCFEAALDLTPFGLAEWQDKGGLVVMLAAFAAWRVLPSWRPAESAGERKRCAF